MGACSRTEPTGAVTGVNAPVLAASSIAVSASCDATPPSRKPRVLWGKSASAMACARATPRPAR
jgi:hypothetical protein